MTLAAVIVNSLVIVGGAVVLIVGVSYFAYKFKRLQTRRTSH